MNILYISQYYPPEVGAPAARVSELSKYWVKKGHKVTVITAMPNHPDGIIHPTYKWEYFKEEKKFGVRVLRVLLYVTPNKGVFKRVISFLSFMITSFIVGILKSGTDVVIATSPQLFVGLSGLIIAKLKGKPFIFEVRDIWPKAAKELGVIKHRGIIRMAEMLEHFLYEKADKIVVVVDKYFDEIKDKVQDRKKVITIENGIDPERFNVVCKSSILNLRRKYPDDFIIGFVGTIGLNHNLTTILKAAMSFNDINVRFVIVGDGADRKNVVEFKKKNNINNVTIYNRIPAHEVPCVLNEMDAGFVNLRNTSLASHMFPAKMFEIFASGKPIIAGIRGVARKLIEENELGYVFEPDNENEFADRVRELLDNPERSKKMGNNARNFVYKHYNRKNLADEYLNILRRD